MVEHKLKTINPFFQNVWNGEKTFEIRFNDRDFKSGDILALMEYDLRTKTYLNRIINCRVTYLLSDHRYVKEGFVVMGIKIISKVEEE